MTQPNDLPPLPEPTFRDHAWDGLYTEHKMTAYGLQCAEAAVERERARCATICSEVAHDELARRQHYASSVAAICHIRIKNGTMPTKGE